MDQQHQNGRGRSPAMNAQPSHINHSHSPSPPRPFDPNVTASSSSAPIGLGLGLEAPLDPSSPPQFAGAAASSPDYSTAYNPNPNSFFSPQALDLSPDFSRQDPSQAGGFSFPGPGAQSPAPFSQNSYLSPDFGQGDFSLFPTTTGEQISAPLFVTDADFAMASSQQQHSPTPPHMLQQEPHQPPSGQASPSFNQHHFSSPPGGHSRNISLRPEAALLPGQVDWTGTQFQGHRRTPSEFSDVSSNAGHSPHLVSQDTFAEIEQQQRHSPMQQPQPDAAGLYSELHGIGTFSISESAANRQVRSPSHSPVISPRITPHTLPDMNQGNNFGLGQNNAFMGGQMSFGLQVSEGFPDLPVTGPDMGQSQMPQLNAPTINIDYAPVAVKPGFEGQKSVLDTHALTPPDRGRPRSRPRAVTDPYNNGNAANPGRQSSTSSLSPNGGVDLSDRSDVSRSLSPLDRQGPSLNRRRQSTSAVPNNVIALRLADPAYDDGATGVGGGPKRVQKHPATFQCTLCPKRFTRAYNLRSHLRTHTDERPFVCTVCGKAFARQHDRKRHEGLHSGEKKFVCKGDLKAGGQWGCGRRFARADALGRHFRSEAGRICIKPLLDEEMIERQRQWAEQRMQQQQQAAAVQQQQQNMQMQGQLMGPPPAPGMTLDPNTGYPLDAAGNYVLPAALLQQYPALAQVNWAAADMTGAGSGMEDDLSGRSSFDASDYDEGEEGYVSGPGTGFGPGSMEQGYSEMGYASDYGGR